MTQIKLIEDVKEGKITTDEAYKQMCGEVTLTLQTMFWLYHKRSIELKDDEGQLRAHRLLVGDVMRQVKELVDGFEDIRGKSLSGEGDAVTYYDGLREPTLDEVEEMYYDFMISRRDETDETEEIDENDDVDLPFY